MGFHFIFHSLSCNKGLCGVSSLPECPLFWGSNGLSTTKNCNRLIISGRVLHCFVSDIHMLRQDSGGYLMIMTLVFLVSWWVSAFIRVTNLFSISYSVLLSESVIMFCWCLPHHLPHKIEKYIACIFSISCNKLFNFMHRRVPAETWW